MAAPATDPWLSPPCPVKVTCWRGAQAIGWDPCASLGTSPTWTSRRIDPTIGALFEAGQLNLGQLFVDPRIEKLGFEFGTHEVAGEIDDVLKKMLPPMRWTISTRTCGGGIRQPSTGS